MQKRIFILSLLLGVSTSYGQLGSRIGDAFKKIKDIKKPTLRVGEIETTVQWNCPYIKTENAVHLPEIIDINVKSWTNKKGDVSFRFNPNIFKHTLLDRGKNLVNSSHDIVSKKYEADKISTQIDYTACMNQFRARVDAALSKELESCESCLATELSISKELNVVTNKQMDKKLNPKGDELKKIPRIYPTKAVILSLTEVNRLRYKVCSDQILDEKDMIGLMSRSFVTQFPKVFNTNDQMIRPSCYQKVIDQLVVMNASVFCRDNGCPSKDYYDLGSSLVELNTIYENQVSSNKNKADETGISEIIAKQVEDIEPVGGNKPDDDKKPIAKITKPIVPKVEELVKVTETQVSLEDQEKYLTQNRYVMGYKIEQQHQKYYDESFIINENETCQIKTLQYARQGNTRMVKYYIGKITDPDFLLSLDLESLSKHCKKEILMRSLRYYHLVDDNFYPRMCDKKECPLIEEYRNKLNLFHTNLIENYFGDKKLAKLYCIEKDQLDIKTNYITEALDFVKSLNSKIQCDNFELGETRVVDNHSSKSPSGVQQKFSIKKVADKLYRARINMSFINNNTKEFDQKMYDRVKSCMKESSQFFKSKQGERIDVEIINENFDVNVIEPHVKITVVPTTKIVNGETQKLYYRSNSANYADNIDCPTITHEVLHLMGLCDEYRENTSAYLHDNRTDKKMSSKVSEEEAELHATKRLRYNTCRSIPKQASVMKNQYEVFQKINSGQTRCECSEEQCEQLLSSGNEDLIKTLQNNIFQNITSLNFNYGAGIQVCSYSVEKGRRVDISEINTALIKKDPIFDMQITSEEKFSFKQNKLRLDRSIDSYVLEVETYSCHCKTPSCKEKMRILKDRVLNKGYYMLDYCSSSLGLKQSDANTKLLKPGAQIHNGVMYFTKDNLKDHSILAPAHFERIKWSGCESKVMKYNTCAQSAYSDTKEECPDRPEYCKDEKQWLESGN